MVSKGEKNRVRTSEEREGEREGERARERGSGGESGLSKRAFLCEKNPGTISCDAGARGTATVAG